MPKTLKRRKQEGKERYKGEEEEENKSINVTEIHFQVVFELNREYLSRFPSQLPYQNIAVRILAPSPSDSCLLCPGGEPGTDRYDATLEFVFSARSSGYEEYWLEVH